MKRSFRMGNRVVFDRDYKIQNPGTVDGVWTVKWTSALGGYVELSQDGRDDKYVHISCLRHARPTPTVKIRKKWHAGVTHRCYYWWVYSNPDDTHPTGWNSFERAIEFATKGHVK